MTQQTIEGAEMAVKPKAPRAPKPQEDTDPVRAMSLAEKMFHVRDEMPDIPKTGKNEAMGFEFKEAEKIVNAVRTLHNKYRIIVLPKRTAHHIHNKEGWNPKANQVTERGVKIIMDIDFEFINVDNPTDMYTVPWTAEGDDFGDKGTNKASTIAQKFMYLRVYEIADSDPDSETPAGGSVAAPSKVITAQKQTTIYRMLKRLGKTVEAYETALKKPVDKMTNEEADSAIANMQAAIERSLASEVS